MTSFKIITKLILSLCVFSGKAQNWVGTYKIKIDIKDQISASIVRANISYDLQLPEDSVFIGVPLPFGNNKELSFIIEPSSTSNPVLYGYFRPENSTGVALILCGSKPAKLSLSFQNVYLQTTPTSYSEDVYGINIIINQSIKNIKKIFQKIMIPKLTEVLIFSNSFVTSLPAPELVDRQNEHKIILSREFNTEESEVVIYIAQHKKGLSPFLLFLLLLTGALGGFFITPKMATPFLKTAVYGMISFLLLVSIPLILHYFISPLPQITDSTTIVALGTVMGFFLGTLIYSIKVISNYWPGKKISAN